MVEVISPKGLLAFSFMSDNDGPTAQLWYRGNVVASVTARDEGDPVLTVSHPDGSETEWGGE